MSALTLGAHDRRGRGTAMQGHSPAAPRDERIDRDAVLWRPEGVGALLLRGLAATGRLLAPLGVLLGLPAMALVLALPFVLSAIAAAGVAGWLGVSAIGLAAAGGAGLAALAVAALRGPRRRLMAYLAAVERLAGSVPRIVAVKQGEVAIVRLRVAPPPGRALPGWRFAELEGPAVLVVRGGREVIWNGTRAGYERWCRETDLASL